MLVFPTMTKIEMLFFASLIAFLQCCYSKPFAQLFGGHEMEGYPPPVFGGMQDFQEPHYNVPMMPPFLADPYNSPSVWSMENNPFEGEYDHYPPLQRRHLESMIQRMDRQADSGLQTRFYSKGGGPSGQWYPFQLQGLAKKTKKPPTKPAKTNSKIFCDDKMAKLHKILIKEHQIQLQFQKPKGENINLSWDSPVEVQHEQVPSYMSGPFQVSEEQPIQGPKSIAQQIINAEDLNQENAETAHKFRPEIEQFQQENQSQPLPPEDFKISQNKPEMMPQNIPEAIPQNRPEAIPQILPETIPQNRPDVMTQDRSEAMNKNRPEVMPQNRLEAIPQNILDVMTQNRPEAMNHDRPDVMPQNRPEAIPQNRPETISQNRPDVMTQNRPEAMNHDRPDVMPQNRPEAMNHDRPDVMPQNIPEAIPQNRPEAISQNRPETISQNRPNVMAQNRPEVMTQNRPEAIPQNRLEMTSQNRQNVVPQNRPDAITQNRPKMIPPIRQGMIPENRPENMQEMIPQSKQESSSGEKPETVQQSKPELINSQPKQESRAEESLPGRPLSISQPEAETSAQQNNPHSSSPESKPQEIQAQKVEKGSNAPAPSLSQKSDGTPEFFHYLRSQQSNSESQANSKANKNSNFEAENRQKGVDVAPESAKEVGNRQPHLLMEK